ncbi:MAG: hypothetical protein AMJ69_10685 [Gammaproteobacteria bacterium SG8_47]|nr:MAG: hypothetical protein AMJ69_10685 [Gammaproteobacteria bacterium SG8_47]
MTDLLCGWQFHASALDRTRWAEASLVVDVLAASHHGAQPRYEKRTDAIPNEISGPLPAGVNFFLDELSV